MYFLDKYGWPVECFKGRWVLNILRLIVHTRRISWRCKNIERYWERMDSIKNTDVQKESKD